MVFSLLIWLLWFLVLLFVNLAMLLHCFLSFTALLGGGGEGAGRQTKGRTASQSVIHLNPPLQEPQNL